MTKPRSGGADAKSDQPEGESAAVRVQTDAASEQDTAEVQTTEPVEGEANEPEDAENTVGIREAQSPTMRRRRQGRGRGRNLRRS